MTKDIMNYRRPNAGGIGCNDHIGISLDTEVIFPDGRRVEDHVVPIIDLKTKGDGGLYEKDEYKENTYYSIYCYSRGKNLPSN